MGKRRPAAIAAHPVAKSGPLSDQERQQIVDAALALMEQVYVHLPLKRAMHAINPVQRLKLLRQQVSRLSEREFHNEMLSIFLRLRDLHTNYILPAPLNRHTAYLPFRIEEVIATKSRQYVVTQVFREQVSDPNFVRGVIVTHWNGVPIDRAVDLNADREAGSNAAARHARGLESLTMRWLGMSLPPDEDWVDVTFHAADRPAQIQQLRLSWRVFESGAGDLGVAQASGKKASALGLDLRVEVERHVRGRLFRRQPLPPPIAPKRCATLATSTPDVFPSCGNVTTQQGVLGYIRIATFDVPDDSIFIAEFLRLLRPLSPDGLIIDVRGNGGGLVLAGERLLQCLTPRRIEPERFQFINTPTTLQISAHADFQKWNPSIAQATATGTELSLGFPLLPEASYNDIGQQYQGPVVLITDALCYSTTDIFAAGFQDHEIGTVLGVSDNTGAGGANVWDYQLLQQFVPGPQSPFPPVPRGAEFRVAVRRTTRVRARSGIPLEDLGVQPDERHEMTLRDVLEGNVDLIEHAAEILKRQPKQSLTATVSPSPSGSFAVAITARNIDRVDTYVNGRPQGTRDVKRAARKLSVKLSGAHRRKGSNLVELRGFRKGELVASTRVTFWTTECD